MKLKKKKISKVKVFVLENNLDEDVFTTYLEYILQLFTIKNLPKFKAVRARYANLFHSNGELK